ncbi:hypothetical protein CROQUDRAFT_40632 [Cronartium quercuum f. sp. fusiforme G11]|uniref:PQ-loop repeat-containing protein 1 n=1 Tax=Cronartium quercuum f. sp. fusiforme G11 TaxID=708437 RepID=A0A9P6NN51_9BASI|nr:hypothetical protein CROQUDRAFT_40632 [Cronartium quercuum f. sp. fusiforme G11]
MTWLNTLASCGMAVGPPLVYLDQYISILKKRRSDGFSREICGVLLIANITRCFYWLGARFETALLVQSILMILAQFALLEACLRFAPGSSQSRNRSFWSRDLAHTPSEQQSLMSPQSPQESLSGPAGIGGLAATAEEVPEATLPLKATIRAKYCCNFWNWGSFGLYCEFLAILVALQVALYVCLQNHRWYTEALGYIALGLESTLPIPQFLTNYQRKSLAGFRSTVLMGWVVGDGFKTTYFFLQPGNSIQFKLCAVLQLSIDILILFQALMYHKKTRRDIEELLQLSSNQE